MKPYPRDDADTGSTPDADPCDGEVQVAGAVALLRVAFRDDLAHAPVDTADADVRTVVDDAEPYLDLPW